MTTFLFFKQRKVINTLTEEHVVKGASVFFFGLFFNFSLRQYSGNFTHKIFFIQTADV